MRKNTDVRYHRDKYGKLVKNKQKKQEGTGTLIALLVGTVLFVGLLFTCFALTK